MDSPSGLNPIRLSISTKLLASLLLILLPLTIVFAASLNLLFISQTAKKKLVDTTLPFLTSSQVLAKSVSDFVLTLDRIPTGSTQADVEERLLYLKAQIDGSLENVEEQFPNDAKVSEIKELLREINLQTEELKKFYLREQPKLLLELRQMQGSLLAAANKARGSIRQAQVRQSLESEPKSAIALTKTLLVDIQLVSSILERYNSSLSATEVRALQNEFSMLVRRSVSDLSRVLDTQLRKQLSVHFEPMLQNIGQKGSFFFSAIVLAEGQEVAAGITAETRALENDLVGEIAALVEFANATAGREFNALGDLIGDNIAVLVVIMIVAIVAAFVIIFFYVRPNIIKRLTRLAVSTRKIAAGDHQADINIEGMDEISQMASAMEIFRGALIDREKLVADLTDSNERLTRFAYVCSHDLREPVRMIHAFTDRLRNHLVQNPELSDEKVERYIDQLSKASRRGQSLIDDILSYSRLDQDVKLLEVVDIRSLLSEIAENFDLADPDEKRRIRFGDMPDVKGNKTQLYQLFQNLISNGLKYNQNNDEAEVRVSSRKLTDGMIEFVVADNGIGIARKHQSQVFEVFRRLHRNDEYSGTGVGLAICKKIVELHNGKIWLKSTPGKGTRFFVTLPAAADSTT